MTKIGQSTKGKITKISIVLLIFIFIIAIFRKPTKKVENTIAQTPPSPTLSKVIDQNFVFPILDSSSQEVSEINYSITKADLLDEVVIKDKSYKPNDNRRFLILTIRLQNTTDKTYQLDTRSYLRLSFKDTPEELFVADVHNDPIVIYPISTKYTRLGFLIDRQELDFQLQVGEVNQQKEIINFTFRDEASELSSGVNSEASF